MDSFSIKNFQNKQSCPATLHNSVQGSFEQPLRKFSMADLTQKINIDKVMVDIKLTPLKSNQFTQKIKQIYHCLNYIKTISPNLIQEVRTAQLIIENIENKFNKKYAETRRASQQNSFNQSLRQQTFQNLRSQSKSTAKKQVQQSLLSKKKPSMNILSTICGSDISPIKQLDEATSRIVYTNFSIKDIESSCKKQLSHQKTSSALKDSFLKKNFGNIQSNSKISQIQQSQSNKKIRQQSGSKCKSVHKRTESNHTVSNFDAEDQQMERLTQNIKALDRVLEKKGLCFKNDGQKDQLKNRAPFKETNLNVYKQSMFKTDKKPLIYNSKQKVSSNKQNFQRY